MCIAITAKDGQGGRMDDATGGGVGQMTGEKMYLPEFHDRNRQDPSTL